VIISAVPIAGGNRVGYLPKGFSGWIHGQIYFGCYVDFVFGGFIQRFADTRPKY
jgi:hypothetical protein